MEMKKLMLTKKEVCLFLKRLNIYLQKQEQRIKHFVTRIEKLEDAMKKKGAYERKDTKVKKVMHEFKEGKLHSGSKKGPVVKSRKQGIAIALSEARKAGAKIPAKKKK